MGVRLFSYRPAGFIRLWNMICNHLPFDSGCLTTPQPTRSRLALSSDMRVLISNDTCESISYFLLSLILLTAGQDLHEECFGAWECILISTVCCRLLQFGLLVHVYRHHLVGCCCAIGRHLWVLLLSPQPPSRRCFRGGFRATSSTTVLYLRGVSSWQHHHDGSCVGGIKNDNKQINVT